MFSRKLVIIVSLVFLLLFNVIALIISGRHSYSPTAPYSEQPSGPGGFFIAVMAPFQNALTNTTRFLENVWEQYFFLVSVAEENKALKNALAKAVEKNNKCAETRLSNARLRKFLNFQKNIGYETLPAEVVGKDPSPWFKTVIIDKGTADGVAKGLPVVVPEGVTGRIIEVSEHFSKVLLILDRNSAVDGLVQRTRARGVIKGGSGGRCIFQYALRKHDIQVGDIIVSSGLDGIFPKGLIVGKVQSIRRKNAGIFQDVVVLPFVDFEKLEEVMVAIIPPKHDFQGAE